MRKYETVSDELCRRMELEKENGTFVRVGCDNSSAIRRRVVERDNGSVWRPTYVHDIDKILHCPFYNRYTDKTQVFSLIRNDDVTRRSLHVQLVSRIARTIGGALNLNLDLIEAIALGHDMGHPPFAHTGERYLNEIYHEHTGNYFHHNVQSVRVLDGIFPYNITLQTLHGILSHNGEIEEEIFYPSPIGSFEEFDELMSRCYTEPGEANRVNPATLEAAVVRISDIIAYLGKDRQDAARVNMVEEDAFYNAEIGSINSEIINNLVANIIENSYGKPYIRLGHSHFEALAASKRENYSKIYDSTATRARLDVTAKPMMAEIYCRMLEDLLRGDRTSPIYTHHIDYVNKMYYKRSRPYEENDPHLIVVDFIASMTESFFIEFHRHLFPSSNYEVVYKGYFD